MEYMCTAYAEGRYLNMIRSSFNAVNKLSFIICWLCLYFSLSDIFVAESFEKTLMI